MARAPNYRHERLERDRKKNQKKEAKLKAQREAVEARRSGVPIATADDKPGEPQDK